jgi:hypothetical protein
MLTAFLSDEWAHGRAQARTDVSYYLNSLDASVLQRMRSGEWDPLHSSLYINAHSLFANYGLTFQSDRTELAHSIEARTPYLDHHLTDFVNRLPAHWKIHIDPHSGAVTEKWILRQAVKPFVTEEAYARQKHPFLSPPSRRSALYDCLRALVLSRLPHISWLDRARTIAFVDQFTGQWMHPPPAPSPSLICAFFFPPAFVRSGSAMDGATGPELLLQDFRLHVLASYCALQKRYNISD